MSSNAKFILGGKTWSYSSVSSYETCPYGFSLSYIEMEERRGNAFSDFGLLVHKILEMYFNEELELEELLDYYEENYYDSMYYNFPIYPSNMAQNYYDSGHEYFENFKFNKALYKVIAVEDTIFSNHNGIKLVTKPDLILKEKSTGKYSLIDFKTARLKPLGKQRDIQITQYMRQFLLYCYFFWVEKDIEINNIEIWFIRNNQIINKDVDPMQIAETMEWFTGTIDKILDEEDWKPNLSKKNKYFCQEICSFRDICKYRNIS